MGPKPFWNLRIGGRNCFSKMWRISLTRILQQRFTVLTKNGEAITNDDFLECIILYNALCTMYAGETMYCEPCYNTQQTYKSVFHMCYSTFDSRRWTCTVRIFILFDFVDRIPSCKTCPRFNFVYEPWDIYVCAITLWNIYTEGANTHIWVRNGILLSCYIYIYIVHLMAKNTLIHRVVDRLP